MQQEDEPRNSPMKFLALAASPIILILIGVMIIGGDFIPRFVMVTMALLAAAAMVGLTILVVIADGFRRRHYFGKETFWLAALLAVFLAVNLVLMFW